MDRPPQTSGFKQRWCVLSRFRNQRPDTSLLGLKSKCQWGWLLLEVRRICSVPCPASGGACVPWLVAPPLTPKSQLAFTATFTGSGDWDVDAFGGRRHYSAHHSALEITQQLNIPRAPSTAPSTAPSGNQDAQRHAGAPTGGWHVNKALVSRTWSLPHTLCPTRQRDTGAQTLGHCLLPGGDGHAVPFIW